MKLLLTFFACLGVSISWSQRDFSRVKITAEKVSDHIFVLYGSGGNMGLAIGEQYAYLIDDQFAPLSEKILAKIDSITDKPVRFLVNTHWHGDHVGGNANFAREGAIILANENVRKRMSTPQQRRGRTVQPAPYIALPQITYTDQITLHLNDRQSMHVMHVNDSHTDGDSYIYFPESNVIHMGDNFPNGYPYIDLESGGNVDGLLKNLNMALAMLDSQTKIIRGHGKVTDKAHLKSYRDMIQTIRDRVAGAQKEGKSLEEVLAMNVSEEWDGAHGQGFINGTSLVTAIYKSLSR